MPKPVNVPIPNLLWVNDLVCAGQGFHRHAGVEVDAALQIGTVDQLAAVKGFFCVGVEEIQVVGFAQLCQNKRGNILAQL